MERELVIERINRRIATDALATHSAVSALLSKDGAKDFRKLIERLNNG